MTKTTYLKKGTCLTVGLSGMLDSTASLSLEKELQQHLDGVREMIMDFTAVEYISSAGLRVLLASEQLMESRGCGPKYWRSPKNTGCWSPPAAIITEKTSS